MRNRTLVKVTIANGTSLSDTVNVNDLRIVGIQMPAGWTAASITFAALLATGTYGKVQDSAGNEVTITSPAADIYVAIADTIALKGLGMLRVRSGTAALGVNQGAERILYLVCVDA